MKVTKIGNCTLDKLIAMLENGWKVKRMIYRGIINSGGLPCWAVKKEHPIVCLATEWYQWQRNEIPEWAGLEHNFSGFNEIVFERPDKNP